MSHLDRRKSKVRRCLTGAAVLGATASLGSTTLRAAPFDYIRLTDQDRASQNQRSDAPGNPNGGGPQADLAPIPNASGILQTISTTGSIDRSNPFFQVLGSTGTTCEDCHFASDAWGVSAEHLRALFEQSQGLHPAFRPHSSNNPVVAAALPANATIDQLRAVYSLMLNKGDALVRIKLALPTDTPPAEFTLVGVNDPNVPLNQIMISDGAGGMLQVGDPAQYLSLTKGYLWLHRRPLPTANETFLTSIGWDGRNAATANPSPAKNGISPVQGILSVSHDATFKADGTGRLAPDGKAPDGHTYTDAELNALAQQMVDFQQTLFVAQIQDQGAGQLDVAGGLGGPTNLMNQPYFFGINDVLQGSIFVDPTTGTVTPTVNPHTGLQPFTPKIFNIYDGWNASNNPNRAAIFRGQELFNSVRLTIDGVGGLNNSQVTLPDGTVTNGPAGPFMGSCGTCHDGPNVGNHSTRLPINIGISDKAPAFIGQAGVADLPLFTFRNNTTGAVVQTTDPGRATRTGKWAHIGEFKGPILRGLAARAPYFHNGMAQSLDDVVGFYNERFKANFTPQEMADLVAFLKAT